MKYVMIKIDFTAKKVYGHNVSKNENIQRERLFLMLPNTNHQFFVAVDSCLIGKDCVLF